MKASPFFPRAYLAGLGAVHAAPLAASLGVSVDLALVTGFGRQQVLLVLFWGGREIAFLGEPKS